MQPFNKLEAFPSSPSLVEQVFVCMILKSVLILGLRTFGATTPQASLSRLFMDKVHFLALFDVKCGGRVHGDPKVVFTFLWWFGAISNGRFAQENNSANKSSTLKFFLADTSTYTTAPPCEAQ